MKRFEICQEDRADEVNLNLKQCIVSIDNNLDKDCFS